MTSTINYNALEGVFKKEVPSLPVHRKINK
jgi:hypothetical protein